MEIERSVLVRKDERTCEAVRLIVSIVDFDRHEVPLAAKRAV